MSEPAWQRLYRIEPAPEYGPQIGAVVEMMHYVRQNTLAAVRGLTVEQLDATPPGFSNSIGMLLAHVAAVERLYQLLSFEGRWYDAGEKAALVGALSMGKEGERARGRDLVSYLADLEDARRDTLAELARRDDAWFASRLRAPDFGYGNHHWAWFHVMEDEVNHGGQMRLLRRNVAPDTSTAAPA